MEMRHISPEKKSCRPSITFILFFYLLLVNSGYIPAFPQDMISPDILNQIAWAGEMSDPDIQWFKNEMRIDPKYTEHEEGIWGMSWMHFITMVFLILFFIVSLFAMYLRNRRTREILTTLLKEE